MNRQIFSAVHSIVFCIILAVLSGCGSSNSGAGSQTSVSFSNPVDAVSLGAALITGTPGSQGTEFWECALSDGVSVFEYRFFNDGTGIETDRNNANVQSSFTWQALSATSLVTTITATGTQVTLTNIQFAGRDSVSLNASENLTLTCKRLGVSNQPATPAAGNTLSYGGTVYPLTHGFEEVFSFSPDVRNDTHRTFEFQVADAEFKLLQLITGGANPLIIWRPDFATVWFRADLHSPGASGFQTATFQYEPDDIDEKGLEVAGRYFFNKASFGVDHDGLDGIDADTNEFIDVVSGTITVTRSSGAQATMSFDLGLEDGTTLTGIFSGLFPVYEY